tara:strand:- start:536 stop:3025 length:2490 start_codon:yes stop_codon:yes gene_type:complete
MFQKKLSYNLTPMFMKKLIFLIFIFLSLNVFSQIPNLSEFISDLDKKEGYLNFYWDDNKGKIYLEIKNLNQELIYINYLSAGIGSNDLGLDRGQIGGTRIIKFVKMGPKILMVQPNYKYRAISNNEEEIKSVEDAFAKSTLWGFQIVASDKNKYLIDISDFVIRDSHRISQRLTQRNQGSFKVDKNASSFDNLNSKNFPLNSELEAFLTFRGIAKGSWLRSVSPDFETFSVRTRHSFVKLPDGGYKPRKFDPRAGYGAMTFYDYASPIEEDLHVKYIRRHRLIKKYPNQEISEAVEPIIYYLDRGVPEPVKSALIEGASWWNEAFEAAGFKNAFQIKVLPEGADMLDVRYNVIQWVHRSTRGWSYGASVVDPRTGEIIKGHVSLGSLRVRQDYLIAEGLLRPYAKENKNDFMKEMAIKRLRQLSAHEVGHTIGLSHNFISSARNRKSVMDYPHPLIEFTNNKVDLSNAYDHGIGDWDKLAINWGYRQFDSNEEDQLNKILQDGYKEDIYFISDQDSRPLSSAHPRSHLWDNGFDAADELNRMLSIRRHILDNFLDNAIKLGEPMSSIEEVLVPMYLLHRYQIEAAAKVLGGLEYNYALKGDNQVITKMLTRNQQVKALKSLLNSIHPKNLSLPEKLIKLIPPRAFGYPRTRETFKSRTGLTFDYLAAAETATNLTLKMLFNPERASRLITLKARDKNNQPGLTYVMNEIINKTILKEMTDNNDYLNLSNVENEISKMVNHSVLNHLFMLANSKITHQEVNARTFSAIKNLKKTLETKDSEEHHYHYLLDKIEKFLSGEINVQYPNELKPPDGSPIGSYGDLVFSCGSEL